VKNSSRLLLGIAAGAALLLTAPVAKAAAFFIDDTSETITVSADDFENGLSINGVLFQSGLGHPATGTFGESLTYSGSWIDHGLSTPGSFAQEAFDPDSTLSDVNVYTVSTAGGVATITGAFCSDPELLACFIPPDAVLDQFLETAAPVDFSQPFLSASWQSGLDVPEPASELLLLAGLAALGALRRHSKTIRGPARAQHAPAEVV
jgi:PEP-CTERM motif